VLSECPTDFDKVWSAVKRDYFAAVEARAGFRVDLNDKRWRRLLNSWRMLCAVDHDAAMREAIEHATSFGVPAPALQPLKDAYASGGRPAVVRYSLDRLRQGGGPPFQLAVLCAEAGEIDEAFAYLGQAIDARDPSLVDLMVGPQFDGLRADPRFAGCVARIGLPTGSAAS